MADFPLNRTAQHHTPSTLDSADQTIKDRRNKRIPLTEISLGRNLEELARKEAQSLQGTTPSVFGYHHPDRNAGATKRMQSVFKVQTKRDANPILQRFMNNNIFVLNAMSLFCEEEHKKLKKFMFDIIQMDADLTSSSARRVVRTLVKEAGQRHEEWEASIDVLDLELQVSATALARVKIAGKAVDLVGLQSARPLTPQEAETLKTLFEEFCSKRGELATMVLKITGLTGNGEFVKRHRYELWDIVEAELLGG